MLCVQSMGLGKLLFSLKQPKTIPLALFSKLVYPLMVRKKDHKT